MKKDIAIVILNNLQFINIKPGIDDLIKKGYEIDIITPFEKVENDFGYNIMFKNIYEHMKSYNYKVYDKVPNNEYKILLEPYPVIDIKCDYYIRYRYGILSAKPNIVYTLENFLKYDAIMCTSNFEKEYLSIFSKTYLTGNMKYINFKKRKITGKPVLLYLPTYGEESSIDLVYEQLKKLKSKYHIIAKVHHGTSFLKNEYYRNKMLNDSVDEIYDQYTDLSDLLEKTNVVLTDNSGALFDALYVQVPVAILTENVNMNKMKDFNTVQYDLVQEGIVPYSNNPKDLEKVIDEALSKKIINSQISWASTNLYKPKNLIKDFTDIIENYLKDNIDMRYLGLHNDMKSNYYDLKSENKKIKDHNADLKNQNKFYKKQNEKLNEEFKKTSNYNDLLLEELSVYQNRKLHKLVNRIYKIKVGGKRR